MNEQLNRLTGGSRIRNLSANAGYAKDVGLGRSLGVGNATYSSILVWKIPWTEEPGRLQSRVSQNQTQPSTAQHIVDLQHC